MAEWRNRVNAAIKNLAERDARNQHRLRELYDALSDPSVAADQEVVINDGRVCLIYKKTIVARVDVFGEGVYRIDGAEFGTSLDKLLDELALILAEFIRSR